MHPHHFGMQFEVLHSFYAWRQGVSLGKFHHYMSFIDHTTKRHSEKITLKTKDWSLIRSRIIDLWLRGWMMFYGTLNKSVCKEPPNNMPQSCNEIDPYIVFFGWNQHSIATNAKTKAVENDMPANQEDQT